MKASIKILVTYLQIPHDAHITKITSLYDVG